MPRAYGSQYGLPRPVNAGTMYTPSVSGHDSARGPTSAAVAMMPRPSRSHWIAAPVTKMAPSIAYACDPSSSVHATVVSSPSTGGGQVGADVHEHERSGAVRVLRHPGREAGLAEERRLLIAGDATDRKPRGARPYRRPSRRTVPLDGRTSGSIERGTEKRSSSSSDQSSAPMSKSIVRLAFDASVTCAAPPVRFQMIHESTVPNATSAVMSTDRRSDDPLELRRREVGVEHETRCVTSRGRGDLRRAARRNARRSVGPATRSLGGAAGRCVDPRPRWSRAGW